MQTGDGGQADALELLGHSPVGRRHPRGSPGSQRVWNVDFHVRTVGRSSLVYVLNTGSRAAANRITDHVVAAWYDLNHHSVGAEALQFVSLFDDTAGVWRNEDFRRVEDLSKVALWSRREELIHILQD